MVELCADIQKFDSKKTEVDHESKTSFEGCVCFAFRDHACQFGLTAFAAEAKETAAAQETAETTVSPSVQLATETETVTESVIEEPTTLPVTEQQTEAQAATEAKPENTELSPNSKEAEAVGAKAEASVGETGYAFDEATGTLHITGSGDMSDYSYSNNAPWYAERGSITKVVIEDGITAIGKYTFCSCSNLTEVSIPAAHHARSEDRRARSLRRRNHSDELRRQKAHRGRQAARGRCGGGVFLPQKDPCRGAADDRRRG